MGFFMHLLLLCMVLLIRVNAFTVANSMPYLQPSCLDHERSALLQFKQRFHTDCTLYIDDSSPKMESWVGGVNADCCSWDGVKCDVTSSHVIGLNLSFSCIYGTFPPNSSLFSLTHLQDLDLSGNDFNLSRIPSEISMLPNLKSLSLRLAGFCCQIPSEISKLSSLTNLDISSNHFSGSIPSSFGNLTMLTTLSLFSLNMAGNFVPSKLSSWLPKLHNLESLDLSGVKLPSEMPSLLANLTNLRELYLDDTQLLTGPFQQEFSNLTQLQTLDLGNNNLKGPIPRWMSQLTNLEGLFLYSNNLEGAIPQWMSQLTNLQSLDLSNNSLEGPIPPLWGSQLTNLLWLSLSYNNLFVNFDIFSNMKVLRYLGLSGLKLISPYISTNTSRLKLHRLELSYCNLTEFPQFLSDQDELQDLILLDNNIYGNIPQWFSDITKDSLLYLDLTNNFLTSFEQPLAILPWTRLEVLDLGNNKFQGELPSLPDSLKFCNFSNNLLTSLNPNLLCNTGSLVSLDLSFNHISGELPDYCRGFQFVGTLQILNLQNNFLSGFIPKTFCNARSLISLDLSNNNMSGQIPRCIGNQLGNSLQFLNLQNNSFLGTILPTFTRLCKLKMISLSHNKLQGQLPRSLVNCTMLEELDIGNNHVNDTFPSWLGSLPTLHVLVLRNNKFHGSIGDPISNLDFRFLRIMDLSNNQFVGDLPSLHIQNMHAMRDSNEGTPGSYNISYSKTLDLGSDIFSPDQSFQYSIMITNKGSEILYPKISKAFRVVDFSSNYFTGIIPDIIGDLKGLQILNLSNNNLHGEIPSSLANLTDLESLDLSQNKLSGTIPQGLSQLTFLEKFNVSHNHLVGPLPQGSQFDTFDNTSYEGNPGLCGSPLSKKCSKDADSLPALSPVPSDEPSDEGNEESEFIDWVIRSLGCLSGCIVGFIMGKLYITDKYHDWFIETFGRQRLQRRVQRAPRHRL